MAVTRFWVGGTGSFSQTAHWSTSSGGGGGASVPGSTDTAIIDALSGGGTYTINGSPTVLSFSCVNINNTDVLQLSGSLTIAAGGTLSLTGASITNRLFINSSTLGTQCSLSVPSGATVTTTNFDPQDINMTGTFSTGATASSIGDALGNTFGWSSVQPDVSATQTINATGSINWSSLATWTGSPARVPLPQDDVVINYAGASATTLTADMPRAGRNISFNGYTKVLAWSATTWSVFGNLTFASGMTQSGNATMRLMGRGSQTLTTAGFTPNPAINLMAFGGTYQQQDNYTIATAFNNLLNPINGTWDANGFNFTGASVNGTAATTAAILGGTGIWTFTAVSNIPWRTSGAGFTASMASATIVFSGTCSTTVTFQGKGFTYGSLNWSSTASTGTLIITGANTFAALQSDYTTARTWQFPASTTTTIKPGGWQISGKPGTQNITINSSSSGTQATLSMPWCGSQGANANYLTIKDINATGGAHWWAGWGSSFTSNVTGWVLRARGGFMRGGRQMVA